MDEPTGRATPEPIRPGRTRDRRGRGRRGPLALPGPYAPSGVPVQRTPRHRFEILVRIELDRLRARHPEQMATLEVAVEDHPDLPDTWDVDVPLATAVPAHQVDGRRDRLVLFRRPLSSRATSEASLAALVAAVLVDEIAGLWGCEPGDV